MMDSKEKINEILKPLGIDVDSSRKLKRISKSRVKKNIKKAKKLIYKLTRQGYNKEYIKKELNKQYKVGDKDED